MPGERARIVWDAKVTGLGVKVFPTGRKSFVLFYRVGGRKRLATLARCAELSLRAARHKAAAELVRIRDGEADPLERRTRAREAPTVAEGWGRFLTEFAPERITLGKMSRKTVHEYRLQADRHILPAIGARRIADVQRRQIELMVRGLPNVTRNRVLALVSRLFRQFEHWEYRAQGTNPARGVERARETARDRVLSPSELSALSAALQAHDADYPASVAAIRFAALTGLRIGEVLAIRWEHVDFEGGRLTLPQTKTGRRQHDLPTVAQAILTALPRLNAWAFTNGRDAAVTYRTVRKRFNQVASAAGLPDVHLHDLRRTVMTAAAVEGVGTHVLRDLLGHKTTAMADRYIRHAGNSVREARERMAAAMQAMMQGGEAGKVVPLRGARNG